MSSVPPDATGPGSAETGRSTDTAGLHADDRLIDAIARGEPVPTDDPVAALLAGWRTEVHQAAERTLAEAAPLAALPLAALSPVALPLAATPPVTRAAATTPAAVPERTRRRRPGPAGPRSVRRRRLVRAIVAGAALTICVGLGMGAHDARPDSPLWAVARVAFPERADAELARSAVEDAQRAVAEGRHGDALRFLDRAGTLLDRLGPSEQQRLRAEIEAIRAELPPLPAPPPDTGGTGGPVPFPTVPPAPEPGGAGPVPADQPPATSTGAATGPAAPPPGSRPTGSTAPASPAGPAALDPGVSDPASPTGSTGTGTPTGSAPPDPVGSTGSGPGAGSLAGQPPAPSGRAGTGPRTPEQEPTTPAPGGESAGTAVVTDPATAG